MIESRVRAGVEAINRGDLDAVLVDWADDAVLVYPGEVSASGEIAGKEAIRAWLEGWRAAFPDLEFTIIGIYTKKGLHLGASNVVAVHTEVRGRNRLGQEVHSSGVSVFTIEGTKIVRAKDYIFDAHRLEEFWAE